MKRSPTWVAVLGIVVQLSALGLCSWAMESARNRGRELPGGTEPPTVPPPPEPPSPPPFGATSPSWSPGSPPPP